MEYYSERVEKIVVLAAGSLKIEMKKSIEK